ncbi:MAG: hypothetical protein ACKVP9_10020, partial [Burkholderiales bacterium]
MTGDVLEITLRRYPCGMHAISAWTRERHLSGSSSTRMQFVARPMVTRSSSNVRSATNLERPVARLEIFSESGIYKTS